MPLKLVPPGRTFTVAPTVRLLPVIFIHLQPHEPPPDISMDDVYEADFL